MARMARMAHLYDSHGSLVWLTWLAWLAGSHSIQTRFLAKWHVRNKRRNSILKTCHYPDLGTASLVVPLGKFDSANQKHYPDLGSDASSVWNLCARFSDVIRQGNQYMVVLPNVSCFLRLPIECRTQWLTRIDFQISFNPDWQIDDGFLKGQSWNEITLMTLNVYSSLERERVFS